VLWRIFELKRDKMTAEWRKLHNEELHNLYSAKYNKNYQVKENEMGREGSTRGKG
jgi:hypothetical protein